MTDFDCRYAAYEASLLNAYLSEGDAPDYDPEEEGYWASLLDEADSR